MIFFFHFFFFSLLSYINSLSNVLKYDYNLYAYPFLLNNGTLLALSNGYATSFTKIYKQVNQHIPLYELEKLFNIIQINTKYSLVVFKNENPGLIFRLYKDNKLLDQYNYSMTYNWSLTVSFMLFPNEKVAVSFMGEQPTIRFISFVDQKIKFDPLNYSEGI